LVEPKEVSEIVLHDPDANAEAVLHRRGLHVAVVDSAAARASYWDRTKTAGSAIVHYGGHGRPPVGEEVAIIEVMAADVVRPDPHHARWFLPYVESTSLARRIAEAFDSFKEPEGLIPF
jgi:hypothetical protein